MKIKSNFIKGVSIAFLTMTAALINISCDKKAQASIAPKTAPVTFAGTRCSTYGIKPFPSNAQWGKYAEKISEGFPGSSPAFVWIVGYVEGNGPQKNCVINFPLEKPVKGVNDFPYDQNEEFLNLCDEKGYKVWLQVEPGDCDLVQLASQTMNRYKNHPSVQGFGVDVEWYKPGNTDGYGTPLTDEMAKKIDKVVKKANPRFNYFVKHWDNNWLPPTYRSDIIFVNDSQGHGSMAAMENAFKEWADIYAPNTVVYQIGYESDMKLWNKYDNPPKEVGSILAANVNENQHCGIIWVDFSLKKVMGKINK